jgi:hypothetical protein
VAGKFDANSMAGKFDADSMAGKFGGNFAPLTVNATSSSSSSTRKLSSVAGVRRSNLARNFGGNSLSLLRLLNSTRIIGGSGGDCDCNLNGNGNCNNRDNNNDIVFSGVGSDLSGVRYSPVEAQRSSSEGDWHARAQGAEQHSSSSSHKLVSSARGMPETIKAGSLASHTQGVFGTATLQGGSLALQGGTIGGQIVSRAQTGQTLLRLQVQAVEGSSSGDHNALGGETDSRQQDTRTQSDKKSHLQEQAAKGSSGGDHNALGGETDSRQQDTRTSSQRGDHGVHSDETGGRRQDTRTQSEKKPLHMRIQLQGTDSLVAGGRAVEGLSLDDDRSREQTRQTRQTGQTQQSALVGRDYLLGKMDNLAGKIDSFPQKNDFSDFSSREAAHR